MPTPECIDIMRRGICKSECIMPDGKRQVRCCDCEKRENQVCGIMAGSHPGMKQCDDCSFPKVNL